VSPWRSEPEAQIILEAEAEPEGVYAAFCEHLAGSEWSENRRPPLERGGVRLNRLWGTLVDLLPLPSRARPARQRLPSSRSRNHGGPPAFGGVPARLALLRRSRLLRLRRALCPTCAVPAGRGGANLGRWGRRFGFGSKLRPPTHRRVPRGARGALLGPAGGGGVGRGCAAARRDRPPGGLERLDV
jgi:hypothetical protein